MGKNVERIFTEEFTSKWRCSERNRCPKLLAVMEYKLNQQNIIACL